MVEAANILGFSRQYLHIASKQGHLTPERITETGKRLFTVEALNEWLATKSYQPHGWYVVQIDPASREAQLVLKSELKPPASITSA